MKIDTSLAPRGRFTMVAAHPHVARRLRLPVAYYRAKAAAYVAMLGAGCGLMLPVSTGQMFEF